MEELGPRLRITPTRGPSTCVSSGDTAAILGSSPSTPSPRETDRKEVWLAPEWHAMALLRVCKTVVRSAREKRRKVAAGKAWAPNGITCLWVEAAGKDYS